MIPENERTTTNQSNQIKFYLKSVHLQTEQTSGQTSLIVQLTVVRMTHHPVDVLKMHAMVVNTTHRSDTSIDFTNKL